MSELDGSGTADRASLVDVGRDLVGGQPLSAPVAARLRLRAEELDIRARAQRLRVSARTADNVAKFGGGSLLTATVALLISGSIAWPVAGVAALTLLSFVVATIFAAAFELRAVRADREAEGLAAVLKEVVP